MTRRVSFRDRLRWSAGFWLLPLLVLVTGCRSDEDSPANPPSPPRHFLLITIDTTRADRLGCYGGRPEVSPTIDRLAAEGVLFERAYATVPLTLPSHASMMTGEWPFVHGIRVNGVRSLSDDATTLAEWLKQEGFQTAAFPAAPVLARGLGMEQGFDEYFDGGFDPQVPPERPATETEELFSTWLDGCSDQRFFAWVHIFEPHAPYTPPRELRRQFATSYEAEIFRADQSIGRMLDTLEARGLLDETLVCITSDHGEGLGDHGEDTHGTFIYDSTMHVPLVWWDGQISGRRLPLVSSLVDLAPTALEWLDLESFACSGQSTYDRIVQGDTELDDRAVYLESYWPYTGHGWSPLEATVDQNWKLIEAPTPELFELATDPGELRNRYADAGDQADTMRRLSTELKNQASSPLAGEDRELSADEIARLRALGYAVGVGTTGPLPAPGPDAGIDPKERRDTMRQISELMAQQVLGNGIGIVRSARAILVDDPTNAYALTALGIELCQREQYTEAITHLEAVRVSGRANAETLVSLGLAFLHTDQLDDAEKTFEQALILHPNHPKALRWLGQVFEQRGDGPRAVETYRRLLEVFDGPPGARRTIEEAIDRLEH